jgi:hypothetical protein
MSSGCRPEERKSKNPDPKPISQLDLDDLGLSIYFYMLIRN